MKCHGNTTRCMLEHPPRVKPKYEYVEAKRINLIQKIWKAIKLGLLHLRNITVGKI